MSGRGEGEDSSVAQKGSASLLAELNLMPGCAVVVGSRSIPESGDPLRGRGSDRSVCC